MKWFLVAILLVLPAVHAQTTEGGSVGADSFLYRADIMWDNLLYKVGIKSADALAKERYAEIEEAKLLGDVVGIEQGKSALDAVEEQITDEVLVEDIETQNQEIVSSYSVNTTQIIDALNGYEKIAILVDGIDHINVETTGLEEHTYVVSAGEGKIKAIEETDTEAVLSISYSDIVLAVHDEEYRNKRMDELLRLKIIEQDKEALVKKMWG